MKTKAIIYDGVDQVRLGDVTLPACGAKQVVAKTIFTFVSCRNCAKFADCDTMWGGEGVVILTPMDRGIEERQRVIEYVRTGRVDPTPFLKTVVRPDEMPAHYRRLQKREIVPLVGDWR